MGYLAKLVLRKDRMKFNIDLKEGHKHMDNNQEETVESVWTNFWKDILVQPDGTLDLEEVKKNLFDFYIAMNNVATVYCHVTGSELSKITYTPDVVISAADAHYKRMYAEDRAADIRAHVRAEREYILKSMNPNENATGENAAGAKKITTAGKAAVAIISVLFALLLINAVYYYSQPIVWYFRNQY